MGPSWTPARPYELESGIGPYERGRVLVSSPLWLRTSGVAGASFFTSKLELEVGSTEKIFRNLKPLLKTEGLGSHEIWA